MHLYVHAKTPLCSQTLDRVHDSSLHVSFFAQEERLDQGEHLNR